MARYDDCRHQFGGYFRRDGWPSGWRWRPINPGWGWCNRYWFNFELEMEFICFEEYCFSEYYFDIETGGFWWMNGAGTWIDCLPDGYHEPISIKVTETVPVLGDDGAVIAYETQVFIYVALWDDVNQVYGYFDWQDNYHVVTFPWLASW
jgi:hypothetical protein